jgi:hypothetical protein
MIRGDFGSGVTGTPGIHRRVRYAAGELIELIDIVKRYRGVLL